MGYLGKLPATQGKDAGPTLKIDDISGDFNGSKTAFDLKIDGTGVSPHINNIQIYLSGVHQQPTTAFTLAGSSSGSQVRFTSAPSSEMSFHGALIGDARLMTPDNDTVEPASLTSGTATTISGSFTSVSSSIAADVASNLANRRTNTTISGSFTSVSASIAADVATNLANRRTDTTISGSTTSLSSSVASDIAANIVSITNNSSSFASRYTNQINQDLRTSASPTFVNTTVTGTLTAQEIHTEFESASILFTSGSTIFGNSSDDVHNMTGSLNVSGALNLNDGDAVFGATATVETGLNLESGTFTVKNATSDSNGLKISQGGSDASNILNHYNGTLNLGVANSVDMTLKGGNVGIGTDNPTDELEVHGATAAIKIRSTGTDAGNNPSINFQSTEATGLAARAEISADDDGASTKGALIFKTRISDSVTEAMRIDSSGNVGIGTNNPRYPLVVSGSGQNSYIHFPQDNNSTSDGLVVGYATEGNAYFYNYENSNIIFGTNNSVRMVIENGGNVGIGTSSPSGKLTIDQGTDDGEILSFKSSDVAHGVTARTETDTYGFIKPSRTDQGGVFLGGYSESDIGITLDATSTTDDTAKSTSANGNILVRARKKDGTGDGQVGSNANLMVIENYDVTRFIFDAEGSGHADVEWTTFSDSRLKSNIETIPYGLDEILQLQPKRFDKQSGGFNENGDVVLEDNKRKMVGFLAQDVKAIIPELVKDVDEEKSFYSMDDGKLTSVLVKAVQQLTEKVESQQKQIEELKEK